MKRGLLKNSTLIFKHIIEMIFKSTGKRGLFDDQNAIDTMSEMGNSLDRLNKYFNC